MALSAATPLLLFYKISNFVPLAGFTLLTVFIIIIIGLSVFRPASNNLKKLDHALNQIIKGVYDINLPASGSKEIKAITENIAKLKELLQKQDQTTQHKIDMLSIASHQLRTPLNNIQWTLQTIQKNKNIIPEQNELLGNALISILRMKHIITSILTLTSIEKNTLEINSSEVNLEELFKETIKRYEPEYQSKNQKIKINCTKKLQIKTDENLLAQILDNLAGNAIKYTPPGGNISLEAKRKGGFVHIKIEDTGYGIPHDQQSYIFDKFYRAGNIQSRKTPGTGLGLHIVKTLLTTIKGRIHFTSKENKGTNFTIILPPSL